MFSNNMNNMIINQRYLASSASVYTEATSASNVSGAPQPLQAGLVLPHKHKNAKIPCRNFYRFCLLGVTPKTPKNGKNHFSKPSLSACLLRSPMVNYFDKKRRNAYTRIVQKSIKPAP